MRYFKDRTEAGKLLAEQMRDKYAGSNCAVLALSEGSAIVGQQIAKALHSSIFLFPVNDILLLPGDNSLEVMHTTSVFNSHDMPVANLEEIDAESHILADNMHLEPFFAQSHIIGRDGELSKELLKRHKIIIVSDGIASGLSLDVVTEYLKPIQTEQIVIATPICSSSNMDKARSLSDDFYHLDVFESEYPVSHYYSDNKILSREETIDKMLKNPMTW